MSKNANFPAKNTLPTDTFARLSATEAGAVVIADDVKVAPILTNTGESTETACALGRLDGARPGFDADTHLGAKPVTPHQKAVRAVVEVPLDQLGVAAERIMGATDADIGQVEPSYPRVKPPILLLLGVLAVVVAVGIVEQIIGKQQWERVLGSTPDAAALVATGVTVLLGVAAWSSAGAWFRRSPAILRIHGQWLAVCILVLIVAYCAAMAFSFAGGVEAPTTGGFTGGTPATDAPVDSGDRIELMKWVVYLLATALFALVVTLMHFVQATIEDRRRVARHVPIRLAATAASVTSAAELLRRRASLLRAVEDVWHQGVDRAAAVAGAYVAGVRSTLDPALFSSWNASELETVEVATPDWLTRLRASASSLEASAEQLLAPGSTTSMLTGRG